MRAEYRLMRLDKPIGITLLLWPCLWALWVASGGAPDLWILAVFVAGVVVTRSLGCVINDYADRHIDPQVKRTSDRPLASGQLSLGRAWGVMIVLAAVALGLLFFLHVKAMCWGGVAAMLMVLYPWMKRWTHWPQLILGCAFSMGIMMAFVEVQGRLPMAALLLWTANVLWVISYDTAYAMMDYADDLKAGVYSTARLFGRWAPAAIALLQGLMCVLLWVLGEHLALNYWYHLGIAAAAINMGYQQVLIRRAPGGPLAAFMQNHAVGAFIFLGLVLGFLQ